MAGQRNITNSADTFQSYDELKNEALADYCKELGWSYDRLYDCLNTSGILSEKLYVYTPNKKLLNELSKFVYSSNTPIFLIMGDVGMGKTSSKDFLEKVIDEDTRYHLVTVDNPNQKIFGVLKKIINEIDSDKKIPSSKDAAWDVAKAALVENKEEYGITTIIWVDEAQLISSHLLSELRILADLKTFGGEKVSKLVLSGTPELENKIDKFRKDNPEDIEAFEDRVSFHTYKLGSWDADNAHEWLERLAEYCKEDEVSINPFTEDAADMLIAISDGKPRIIVDAVQSALEEKSMKCKEDENEDITIDDDLGDLLQSKRSE